jgi:hypothetical protein
VSDANATYSFLPWLRRGIATEIARVDGSGPTAPRAAAPITLVLRANAAPETREVSVPLALFGPGEVVGLDWRNIVRECPPRGSHDVEPNYFPTLEFDQPDFPWRYTPARARPNDRLQPWLVLVALKLDEIEAFSDAGSAGGAARLKVKSAASLPLLAQAWAWAHVQVSGAEPDEALQTIVDEEPRRALSRLICPRRLDPQTRYRVCLVPAFERGRLAGLGREVPESLDALEPAWAPEQNEVELPVYHHWTFETGVDGDFEYLARKLRARAVPPTVGTRPIDVTSAGAPLPPASPTPLSMPGALLSPGTPPDGGAVWEEAHRAAFVNALSSVLNHPADLLEGTTPVRLVAPSLYGAWHAKQDRQAVTEPPPRPRWFHELNRDPRWRVAAGLGTEVVQNSQESLMAAAWDQVEGILGLNEQLRRSELALELSIRLHQRRFATLPLEALLAVTAPIHARVTNAAAGSAGASARPATLRALVLDSPIADGAFDPSFRRLARARGLLRRLGTSPARLGVITRMNRGDIAAAAEPRVPADTLIAPENALPALPQSVVDSLPTLGGAARRALRWLSLFLLALVPVCFWVGAPVLAAFFLLAGAGAWLVASGAASAERRRWHRELQGGTLTGAALRTAEPAPGYVPLVVEAGSHEPRPLVAEAAAAPRVREVLADLLDEWNVEPAPGRRLRPLDLPATRQALLVATEPRRAIAASLLPRLRLIPGLVFQPNAELIEPVMAAPVFERPMYEPLRDLSKDWLLPGVGDIPANTTTLVVTNQSFIEAYMAGLNHEMARELLWREYPTDQRGTYFRQFWDVRGVVASDGTPIDPEQLKDIRPMHTWRSLQGLGANTARKPPPGGQHLVLLIKGELLHRYPNTVVYAVKTQLDRQGKRELSAIELYPVFEGRIEPDIAFFGFELTPAAVRGDPDPTRDQGYYFVLQEQPSEPRFGLDVIGTTFGAAVPRWNDLAWSHLAANANDLTALSYVDLDAPLPNTASVTQHAGEPAVSWHADSGTGPTGAKSSDIAYITLQRPFRVAIHASDMLPPEES